MAYHLSVLTINLLLRKSLFPYIAEKPSLPFTSCLSHSPPALEKTCLQWIAWSTRMRFQLLRLSPTSSHCSSAPWGLCLEQSLVCCCLYGFAPSLKVSLGIVNPFSLGGYSYRNSTRLLPVVVGMAGKEGSGGGWGHANRLWSPRAPSVQGASLSHPFYPDPAVVNVG